MGVKKMVHILMLLITGLTILSAFSVLETGWEVRKQKKKQGYAAVNHEFATAIEAIIGLSAGLYMVFELAEEASLPTYMSLGFQTSMIVLTFLLNKYMLDKDMWW